MFICKTVPFLTHLHVPSSEYVYVTDEHADEIYFIVSGRAQYVFGEDDVAFKTYDRGSYFGDVEVIMQIPRKYNVKAIEDLELLVLSRDLWFVIKHDFRSIATEMSEVARIRDVMADNAKRKANEKRNLKPSKK